MPRVLIGLSLLEERNFALSLLSETLLLLPNVLACIIRKRLVV